MNDDHGLTVEQVPRANYPRRGIPAGTEPCGDGLDSGLPAAFRPDPTLPSDITGPTALIPKDIARFLRDILDPQPQPGVHHIRSGPNRDDDA